MKQFVTKFKQAASKCRQAAQRIIDALEIDLDKVISAEEDAIKVCSYVADSIMSQLDAWLDIHFNDKLQKRRDDIQALAEYSAEVPRTRSEKKKLAYLEQHLQDFASRLSQIASHLEYVAAYISASSGADSVSSSTQEIHNYHGPVVTNSSVGGMAVGGKSAQAKGKTAISRTRKK